MIAVWSVIARRQILMPGKGNLWQMKQRGWGVMAERLNYPVISLITKGLIGSRRGVEIPKNFWFFFPHLETFRSCFRCHKSGYCEIYLFNTGYKCNFNLLHFEGVPPACCRMQRICAHACMVKPEPWLWPEVEHSTVFPYKINQEFLFIRDFCHRLWTEEIVHECMDLTGVTSFSRSSNFICFRILGKATLNCPH